MESSAEKEGLQILGIDRKTPFQKDQEEGEKDETHCSTRDQNKIRNLVLKKNNLKIKKFGLAKTFLVACGSIFTIYEFMKRLILLDVVFLDGPTDSDYSFIVFLFRPALSDRECDRVLK